MNIRHKSIKIDPDDPFKECRLQRRQYADVLSKIINKYSDGFVLAINNNWGAGKTTFVKMWEQELKNQGTKTLYFNAWENDFEKDPLVALVSELENLSDKNNQKKFKKVIEKAAPLAKNIALGIVKAQIEKYIGKDNLKNALVDISEFGIESLQSQITAYASRKKSIDDFKTCLTDFVLSSSQDKPIVFIIDEMDRCRPDYAVEVLEQIKHLFTVPGIIFTLSIDKTQLGHAIRGVYGSEQIDSDEYLRRFIDIEYSLPEPKTSDFVNYLYDYFDFNEFINSEIRLSFHELRDDGNDLLNFATFLFSTSKISLRIQEKIFAHARLTLNLFEQKNYLHPEIFILLIFLRQTNYDIYSNIKTKSYSIQELVESVEKIIPQSIDNEKILIFIWVESLLLKFYSNNDFDNEFKLIGQNKDGNKVLLFESRFDTTTFTDQFIISFDSISNKRYYGNKLSSLINKIELTESFQSN